MLRRKYFVVIVTVVLVLLAWEGVGAVEVVPLPLPCRGERYPADAALLTMWGISDGGERSASVSRVEMVRMAVRALGRDTLARVLSASPPEMADAALIHPDDWGYVNAAGWYEMVTWGDAVRFRPDEPVLAAEALAVLVRGLGVETARWGPYPAGVLAAAEEEGLLPLLEGRRWDDQLKREEVYGLLVAVILAGQRYRECVVGLVDRVCGDRLWMFTRDGDEEFELAPAVYLAGAADLQALPGHVVCVHFDTEGLAGYIVSAEKIHSRRGTLEAYSLRRGELKIGGEWVALELEREGAVRWECNGMPFIAFDPTFLEMQLETWVSEGADCTVHLDGEGRGRVVVEYSDVDPGVITGLPREEASYLTVLRMGPGGFSFEQMLPIDMDDVPVVEGAVDDVRDLQVGDVVRLATVGGWGWDIHRIEVIRERVGGALCPGGFRMRRSIDRTTYWLRIDDTEVEIREDEFLGDLEALLDATLVEVALDGEGRGVYSVEARKLDDTDPVMLREYWKTSSARMILVEYRDRRIELETTVEVEELAGILGSEDRPAAWLVFPVTGGDGVVEELHPAAERETDLDDDTTVDDRVVVVSFNHDEGCVTLRIDNLYGDPGYVVLVDPLIYGDDGRYLVVDDLEAGDEVVPYRVGGGWMIVVDRSE